MQLTATTFLPWSHYRFNAKRKNNNAPLVLIVDIYHQPNPAQSSIILMDVRDYQPNEPRVFTTIPALDLFTLLEKGKVKPHVPK